jgi:hypothetical protein
MASKAPTQNTSVFHAAVAIALDNIDPKLWDEVVQSQGLNELAAIRLLLDPNANRKAVYELAAQTDILIVLYSRALLFTKRFQTALANSIQIDRPAVLFVQAVKGTASGQLEIFDKKFFQTGLHDVRKGLEEIVSGLKAGSVTPLRAFAPQLEEALIRSDAWRKEPEQTQSASRLKSWKKRHVEFPPLSAEEERARSTANQPETAADDDGPVSASHFDKLRQSDFSELAWQMLQVARRLGEGRQRPQATARRLITSMILSGLRRKGDDRTGSWLVSLIEQEHDAIRTRIANRYPAATRHKGSFDAILRSDLKLSENMTEALQAILETARVLATEARPGMPVVIGARHLLGAAVRQDKHETSVQRTLRDFGLNVDDVRQQLIDKLPSWGLDDDQEAWRRVLEPVVVDVERRLPTYAADSAVGPDLIGITREVEAMASLVSAWSVEPPLSIGLFGEWGSGKSFFMQKMKERVRQIAIEARKSKQAQRDFGYYKNIVQVEFNAWHYVEGNLWASLVEHIFTNLRFEGTADEKLDSEKNIEARRKKMLSLLHDRTADANAKDKQAQALQDAAKSAQQSANDADTRAAEAKARADQADLESAAATNNAVQKQASAQDTSEIRRSMLLKDVVEEVQLSQEVRGELETGLTQLGITKERLQTVQGFRDALREATETSTLIAEGFALLRQNGGWLLLLWAVAVPVAVIVLGLVFDGLASISNAGWVQRIGTTVSVLSGLMTGIVASWKKLKPRLQPLVDLVKKMKAKRVELEANVEAERQRRANEAAKLEQDVIQKQSEAEAERRTAADKAAEALKARQEAEKRRAEAERAAKEAADARAAAEALTREAEALRPERRIATFIQDRAAATDYRRHLGVPALIRRDFEKLSEMFETQRKAEEKGEDCGVANQKNDPTVVNRIILYIDDLDRCPPQKVVDVLRAIHLLLAFRLFVVVVAVDARWMKRSLKDRFSLMLTTAETRSAAGAGKGSGDGAPSENIAWRATASPDDYLEKIFQVPFWIRPLGLSGSRRLVTELTRHDVESDAALNVGGSPANVGDGNRAPVDERRTDSEKKADTPAQGTASVSETRGPVQDASAASGQTRDTITPPKPVSEWSPIEPKPRTLMLTPDERNYMLTLAQVIGRSPRSVKRFVNCYRLLKSTLDPVELDRAKRSGTFRTSMLLLGIVTGFPEAAPALLADLRDARPDQAPEAWARAAAKRLQLEDRRKWAVLLPIISQARQWDLHTITPLVDAAALVDRFSFSPVQRPVEELV